MIIPTYQVNNILKVYANRIHSKKSPDSSGRDKIVLQDNINISAGARKKAIADKVRSRIIERIIQYGTDSSLKNNISQKTPSDTHLYAIKAEYTFFKFREIGTDGEQVKIFSMENPKNLIDNLKREMKILE